MLMEVVTGNSADDGDLTGRLVIVEVKLAQVKVGMVMVEVKEKLETLQVVKMKVELEIGNWIGGGGEASEGEGEVEFTLSVVVNIELMEVLRRVVLMSQNVGVSIGDHGFGFSLAGVDGFDCSGTGANEVVF